MDSAAWKELGKKVAEIGAPILGGVLGGPAGAALGTIVGGLFGADPTKPEEILQKLTMDPMAVIKLKELELSHKVRLEELLLQGRQMELADVANARMREVETTKATGKRDPLQFALAILGVILPITIIALLIFYGLPNVEADVKILLGGFIGVIVARYGTIFDYFFGSSAGSAAKTKMLANGNGKSDTTGGA